MDDKGVNRSEVCREIIIDKKENNEIDGITPLTEIPREIKKEYKKNPVKFIISVIIGISVVIFIIIAANKLVDFSNDRQSLLTVAYVHQNEVYGQRGYDTVGAFCVSIESYTQEKSADTYQCYIYNTKVSDNPIYYLTFEEIGRGKFKAIGFDYELRTRR